MTNPQQLAKKTNFGIYFLAVTVVVVAIIDSSEAQYNYYTTTEVHKLSASWKRIENQTSYRSNVNVFGEFPKNFLFGATTAAYQIEGAWNRDGRSTSIWDTATLYYPELVADRSNGNIASNSYDRFVDDIKALKEVGLDFYRFSISWSRILPTGDISSKNELGLKYYEKLIDTLLENGIEPMVTMYNWDLPQALQDLGGWTNPIVVDYFTQYAKLLFERFGEKVKTWFTLNDPVWFCMNGYGKGTDAPLIKSRGFGEYLCVHHALLANAWTYNIYHTNFENQRGRIGIAMNMRYYFPKDPTKQEDINAAKKSMDFNVAWIMHPIFSNTGDYPTAMRRTISENSQNEGLRWSRLPEFSHEEKVLINGSSDFVGVNYYTSRIVAPGTSNSYPIPSFEYDQNVMESIDPSWMAGAVDYSVPEGLRHLLRWIKINYDNPLIFISENGWIDFGEDPDKTRIKYIGSHLQAILDSIWLDEVRVIGYSYKSLIDCFEWMNGYTIKSGLFHVNFSSIDRKRSIKHSANFLRNTIKSRQKQNQTSFIDAISIL